MPLKNKAKAVRCIEKFNKLFNVENYVYKRQIDKLLTEYSDIFNENSVCKDDTLALKLQYLQANVYSIVEKNNQVYIKNSLIKYKNYFDSMFKSVDPNILLDDEQRRAILIDEDYSLIVAGAGSGKTTTMAAKVKFLIEKKRISPDEIIILSFTNKSVEDLNDVLNNKFKLNVDVLTFHKLGMKLLRLYYDVMPKIVGNEQLNNCINEYFNDYVLNDKSLIKKYNKYFKEYINIDVVKNKILRLINKIIKKTIKFNVNNDTLKNVLINFIHIYKEYGYENINNIINNCNDIKIKNMLFLIKDVYKYYNRYLDDNNYIDFQDMIIKSTEYLAKIKNNNYSKYKYIIIDEYQDISNIRFNLIKKISDLYEAKVVAVGDDWQSIYSFSGSDISLFTRFREKFGYAEMIKITNTYRNSQELIDIAGNFILKNSNQIYKKLNSNKHLINPIQIVYYKNDFIEKLSTILDNINIDNTVLLLGRFNNEINKLLESKLFILKDNKLIYKKKNLNIDFLSVHKSKGLGYDQVILLNGLDDIKGFPSKKDAEPIIKYLKDLNNTRENIIYPEERRLFYVALTRTKNYVYIMSPSDKKRKSIFIKELESYKN